MQIITNTSVVKVVIPPRLDIHAYESPLESVEVKGRERERGKETRIEEKRREEKK
jgi:hypothetical protein